MRILTLAWPALLAMPLALLLQGCPLTGGGGTTFSIRAIDSQPLELRLDPGSTATARVAFTTEIDNIQVGGAVLLCDAVRGVPGGLTVSTHDCQSTTFDVTVQAVTAPAGEYLLEFPVTLCVRVAEDPSLGDDRSCASATAVLRVVVTGAPSVPDAWQPLGEALNLDATSTTEAPTLVVDRAGQPLAAWVENGRVVVRRWDGSAWQTLGPGPAGATALGRAALAIDDQDRPVVAWTEARTANLNGPTQVQARRWDGSAWTALGPSPLDSTDATDGRDPALLTVTGAVHIAWAERTGSEGGERIVVQQWSGSQWTRLGAGGALPAPGLPARVQLALHDGAQLAVAWQNDSDRRIRVVALPYSGPWAALGDFAAPNAQSFALSHAPAQGLLLAIAPSPPEPRFTVRRHTGSGWEALGSPHGVVATGGLISHVAMGTEAASGAPLLAWGQFTTTQRHFEVRRWSGTDWVPLGDLAGVPPLARTANGTPLALAVAGGARPFLATQVVTTVPADEAIRVYTFR